MLIFDQLRKNDRQLRLLAVAVLSGLCVLVAGLWYVQVLSARRYKASQVSQSFRTVRSPAIRGKIFDANGAPLADNRPSYNVSLYLEELRPYFQREYSNLVARVKPARSQRAALGRTVRYHVVSNLVAHVTTVLGQPLSLNETNFHKHYDQRLALPMPVLTGLTPEQTALFMEQCVHLPGLDLEVQPVRTYPHRTLAAHLVGYLRRDDRVADEETFFNYRMPDFRGIAGIEGAFDEYLRGKAGIKSVLVNNLGYRQSENIWTPAEAGQNVVLTIDLAIQKAAEQALRSSVHGPLTRGAVVVMDARNGDLLALASNPTFDPNEYISGISTEEWRQLTDPTLLPLINRATAGVYQPGSIFKLVVGLAGLEAGTLDPREIYHSPGYFKLRDQKWGDTAGPGAFDFRRALIKSSNPYFQTNGLKVGVDRILELGERLHLGERSGLQVQEAAGDFPTREWQQRRLGGVWFDGNTANLCIGQGEIAITPLQIAVMTAAIANGGTVYWPRLFARTEPQDFASQARTTNCPAGRVRDRLRVSRRSLDIVRDAMLADVEDGEGTGRRAAVAGMRICAKTGTAEITRTKKTTWLTSFAPYGGPRYVVVVMVEDGVSGGETCGPIAQQVYLALQKREQKTPRTDTLARNR